MCLELKITTLWPIVGKSPKGMDCSGKAWCVTIWTLHLRKPFTWTTEDFCGRNNQEGLCEWKKRKQPVVIVIQAKDEEEVVDGPCYPLYYGTLQDKNGNFMFLLSQRWEFIGQLLQMFL